MIKKKYMLTTITIKKMMIDYGVEFFEIIFNFAINLCYAILAATQK